MPVIRLVVLQPAVFSVPNITCLGIWYFAVLPFFFTLPSPVLTFLGISLQIDHSIRLRKKKQFSFQYDTSFQSTLMYRRNHFPEQFLSLNFSVSTLFVILTSFKVLKKVLHRKVKDSDQDSLHLHCLGGGISLNLLEIFGLSFL